MPAAKVLIELTKSEALVLFEFLSRFSKLEKLSIEDQSEQQILYNLLVLLEKQLEEPFQENYLEVLAKARSDLKDES